MGYFADSDSNGNIIGYYSDDIHASIPPTAISITDSQWEDSINNQGKYVVKNGEFVEAPPLTDAEKLTLAQIQTIDALKNEYTQAIQKGFQATIGTTSYTFGWSADDKANLMATQDAITDGFLTFPINYSDINGHPVPLSSQADLDAIKKKASSFFSNQHQQILNLIGQAQKADLATISNIVWSSAAY